MKQAQRVDLVVVLVDEGALVIGLAQRCGHPFQLALRRPVRGVGQHRLRLGNERKSA